MTVREGELLWSPPQEFVQNSNLTQLMNWLKEQDIVEVDDYSSLWQWSVDQPEAFWGSLWQYFDVQSDTPYKAVVDSLEMRPGVKWFEGSRVNFAEHILRHAQSNDGTAIYAMSEAATLRETSWPELARQVRVLATALRARGIKPGDSVCGVMPNLTETVVAMLAAISVGAVWSNAAPEFGAQAINDRLGQAKPKMLFLCDGYEFNGKQFDRAEEFSRLIDSFDSLDAIVRFDVIGSGTPFSVDKPVESWESLMAGEDPGEQFLFERVPSDHPLWYVFSSGTTGLPKAIAHSHVGVLMEMLKFMTFHMNLKPGDTSFFYTTTGWVMFNLVVGMMLTGASIALYDGSPVYPSTDVLWKLAETSGATVFGASPSYVQLMEDNKVVPKDSFDLSRLNTILVGGSPSMPATFAWFYNNVKQDLWLTSQSGGTEIASAFVAASPTLPVHAAEIQARALAMNVDSLDDDGKPVRDDVGELICRTPFPSMPLYFLNDPDMKKYWESYFEEIPGVWRHGDFIKINQRGGCYIYGRSDATLNRYGVRIGTAEIYRAVESMPEISDSMIVCVETGDGGFYMPLFVQLAEGATLDENLNKAIAARLKSECSPRHVPDEVVPVSEIPYTLTGKKLEVPVRKLLLGYAADKVVGRGSMKNADAIDYYIDFAADFIAKRAAS
ncbi:acetoacetate--CoA ligase [Spongiibacter nanhainus]|uniref:Acetoacetate--CoA ligase n=1 Tax=Spongiibacter nanhainus TaxID=2794344 RepID=A0A7T4R014_9GAMM|nr:acetoacetate--CoA ligase [Spongiibacter nanhainus]QQD17936.1 acetoacetate--CoA ligase [Spongiibacter nanhainus]